MVPRRSGGIANFISDDSAAPNSKQFNDEKVTKLQQLHTPIEISNTSSKTRRMNRPFFRY